MTRLVSTEHKFYLPKAILCEKHETFSQKKKYGKSVFRSKETWFSKRKICRENIIAAERSEAAHYS
jgi:hypothetical protein